MKRILVIRTDRLGDAIMVTPMVRELRRTYPDAYIGVMTRPATSPVFMNNPHVDAILTDDMEPETFRPMVRQLRRHRFTHGLLVFPTERGAWQMLLAGIPRRVTTGHKLYAVLTLTRGVSRHNYVPLRHEADYCMDLARAIGVVTDNLAPELFLSTDERSAAAKLLAARGLQSGEKMIILHSGSGGSAPNLSETRYLDILRGILASPAGSSAKIVLTAREMSPEFRKAAAASAPGRVIDIADDLTGLRSFMACIGAADVMISPSTGSLHIADGLDIPVVGLHCHRPVSSARHWGCLNRHSINLEVSAEYCRAHCSADQNSCAMENGITTESIIGAMEEILRRHQPPVQHRP
jgi:ADP-heptose:LPS heptosyltransferase